ncbi:hypothetical protein [Trichothermofontia sp.]
MMLISHAKYSRQRYRASCQITLPKILPIGHLIGTDTEGYLVNECHWSRIQSPWLELVEAWRSGCRQIWGDCLHSLYLRGSVPRGAALPHLSDLDGVIVLQDEWDAPAATSQTALADLRQSLLRQYRFCRNIEALVFSDDEIQRSPTWQALLKVSGLCIEGQNRQPEWPPVKPGPILVSHAFDLAADIAEVRSYLRSLPAQHWGFTEQVKNRCAWINRRLVRVGFELIMTEEQAYTRDLYPCYQRFAAHFPHLERLMRKALELAIAPSSHRSGLLLFLEHLGTPLIEQVHQTFAPEIASLGQHFLDDL